MDVDSGGEDEIRQNGVVDTINDNDSEEYELTVSVTPAVVTYK